MKLFTDYADPYQLTLTARVGFDERERARGISLSEFLPNLNVNGTSLEVSQYGGGLNEVAEFRAFDAENSFGEGHGGQRLTVPLAALGRQERVSEWDQLQMRNISDKDMLETSQLRVAKRIGAAIADRLELARGQVIQTAKFSADENGFKSDMDFGRGSAFTVTAATKWDQQDATPIDDITAWVEAYVAEHGVEPEAILMSKKALSVLKKATQVQKFATAGQIAQIVNSDYLNGLLMDHGLPMVREYNRKVRKGGKAVDVIDAKVAVLVPPAELEAGMTALGTTLESLQSNYNLPHDEQAGIAVGAYKSENPIGIYINGAAIAMPVLANANAFMAATVLT
ncbi:major capsid protein [Corynebacterium auriscanis]|uniref:Major capsid protein E n=1 Tax=Corynebacterium auriscanis TaxID=99807 RepID=A0A0A2DJQ5_9CORY|nr:major capsid protein [Corynebacterium auriscanis]KGM18149.1 hypothetical protein MA47_09695 [Corynebacterium auriscanis]WJY73227.1 Phage major capsid protein E [Corynebacterium auriscanis]